MEQIYGEQHISKVELIDGGIVLDGTKLESIVSFEIKKSSADATTELFIRMLVTC